MYRIPGGGVGEGRREGGREGEGREGEGREKGGRGGREHSTTVTVSANLYSRLTTTDHLETLTEHSTEKEGT